MKFSLPRPQLSWLLSSLFLAVIVCASIVVTLSRTSQVGGWQALVVRSGSMAPAIPTGSVVLVQRQTEYSPNDIITFRDDGQLLTHRVVEKNVVNWQGQYVTKGDANQTPDHEPVAYSAIAGKVAFSIPLLGYFFSFLQTPLGVTLFVVIPGTILMYEHLKRIRQAFSVRRSVVTLMMIGIALAFPVGHTLAAYATSAQVQGIILATGRWILPQAQYSQDEANLTLAVTQAGGIDRIQFQVQYSHVRDGQTIQESLTGEVTKDVAQEDVALPAITIGTCSADVCVPHKHVEDMKITLKYLNGDEQVHETTDSFAFQE